MLAPITSMAQSTQHLVMIQPISMRWQIQPKKLVEERTPPRITTYSQNSSIKWKTPRLKRKPVLMIKAQNASHRSLEKRIFMVLLKKLIRCSMRHLTERSKWWTQSLLSMVSSQSSGSLPIYLAKYSPRKYHRSQWMKWSKPSWLILTKTRKLTLTTMT